MVVRQIKLTQWISCLRSAQWPVDAGCEEWQAERARQFFEAANINAYYAAGALWELAYQYEQQGFGYDYIEVWSETAWQFYQMYFNSVR